VGDALTLEPGTLFADDYRVERLLSEGAQGAVYAVEQLSTRRPRALKLMLPELVQRPELRRRFETEARVGARIQSDHVVEVIASGVDAASGAPWIVMEYLEGEELGAFVTRRGPVPPADVREIFGQLCHAVGAAHRASIVHRDLKPENVILAKVRQRGAGFMVKVIDFGVARIVAEAKTVNATQSILGTPLWMAPEQVTPGIPIKPAADVWSLGLIAYYVLTGRSFWLMAYEPEASLWRILNEVCVTAMPSASARAAEQKCADLLPEGFDAWFARCVDRDQNKRFADATAAYEALEALLPPPPPRSSMVSRSSLPDARSSSPGARGSDSGARVSPAPAGAVAKAPVAPPAPVAAAGAAVGMVPTPTAVPAAASTRARWLWAAIGVGVVAAIGVVGALVRLLR
jgi:serine/threonine protein kinase